MIHRSFLYFGSFAVGMVMTSAGGAAVGAAGLHITAARTAVPEGGTLVVKATVAPSQSGHAGLQLWPYVNDRQWGAAAKLDRHGEATLMLPLPLPGTDRINVVIRSAVSTADWIWSHTLADHQSVYFQRRFRLGQSVKAAGMLITCDDGFRAWLNGHEVGTGGNFQHVHHLRHLGRFVKPGENVLSVRGYNDIGPAGLLARLTIHTAAGNKVIITNGFWHCFAAKPAGWPAAAGSPKLAQRVRVIAQVGGGVWGRSIRDWPGIHSRAVFPVGRPLPPRALISNTVSVRVMARKLTVSAHRRHLVGMEYEPWFTPLNATWSTAEAIPLLGKYSSFNPAVIRQHALWLDQMGIHYILIDWSNNLWGKTRFSQRPPGAKQLIAATTLLLKTYAQMRRHGLATPQVTLLLGLDNGPVTTTTAINGEMAWIYRKYIQNPRFAGLWLYYHKKPLIVPFNGGGPAFLAGRLAAGEPPINTRDFTIRWMASQLQSAPGMARAGYWSWMDGSIQPIPTYHHGKCEALTITPAFFANGGWLAPSARARDNGFTYIREFKAALQYRPHFLTICQWNEFAGQPIDHGYGPQHNNYVDCYNLHLNNDIEPTSLTACAYRGCGGWGFYYLNLTRACINLYHQKVPRTTVLAIGSPDRNALVTGRTLHVRWACIGKPPQSFTLLLDGRKIASHIRSAVRAYTVKTADLKPGRHELVLRANGAVSVFALSYRGVAHQLNRPIPTVARETFVVSLPKTSRRH